MARQADAESKAKNAAAKIAAWDFSMIDRVGIEVETELNPKGQPRWQYARQGTAWLLVDTGYSDQFVRGIVIAILHEQVARIQYPQPDGSAWESEVALEGHDAYEPDQWTYPGFPTPVMLEQPELFCTCGSHATYGINNGAHSSWCDLSE